MKSIFFLHRIFFSVLILFAISLHAQNLDSLKEQLRVGSDKEKLNTYASIISMLRNNKPYEALDYLSQAIDIASKIGDSELKAQFLQQAGRLHFTNGNFARAKESYQLALQLHTDLKNEKGQAECNSAIAGLYFAQGNLPAAAEGYLLALRYYEQKSDRAGMLNALSNLGSIYSRQNNFTKAIEYNVRAIKLYEESSDKFRTLVGYDQIGNIYLKQGEYGKAEEYFKKSLRLYTEIANKAGIAFTLLQLGNISYHRKNSANAIAYYSQSLKIAESLKTMPLVVSNLNALGELYFELKNYKLSEKYYQKAISISKELGLKIELETAYNGLAQVYKSKNETVKSQTFRALSSEMKDSLYNDSIVKKLADIQLTYESEKKQSQIEILSKEQKIRESELLRERQIRKIFTIASIVLGIVFIVLVLFYIQNKRIASSLRKQKTELEIKNREIIEQTEKLRQLNTVKDRFFSIISHDLRNNLTTMRLYFDLISTPGYALEDSEQITKQIASSVENTIDLLENLLVWASTQIKGIPMHIQKINLHSLTEENISLLQSNAVQKRITLSNIIPEATTAYGDIDMIRLVLRNLISNATKFTPENGHIEVSAETDAQYCKVIVKDNGVGISKQSMDRLFNQHENPTTKGTGNEKGTGLGLILCKDFIERNGGHIWAESEEGKGSRFIFELPSKNNLNS